MTVASGKASVAVSRLSRHGREQGMRVLVCVKRVPMTGGTIVLTEDAQAIETRHLGFTISPHEECGVEEAVRLVEAHGGESVVLTLGPDEAEEQLRDAMAIGIDRAIHLVVGDEEWDPQATAAAIVEAIREDEAAHGPFDLVFFGNESADAGNYQVGIRVAHALGRPVATGLKALTVDGGAVRCEQEVSGGPRRLRAAAARRRDGARGAQPAALPVGSRAASGRSGSRSRRIRRRAPTPGSRSSGSSCPRARASRPRSSARARRRPRGSSRCCGRSGSCDGDPRLRRARGRRRRRAVAAGADPRPCLRRRLGAGDLRSCRFDTGAAAALAGHGVETLHVAEDEVFGSYAPRAIAEAIVEVVRRLSATAVVGPGNRSAATRSSPTSPRCSTCLWRRTAFEPRRRTAARR